MSLKSFLKTYIPGVSSLVRSRQWQDLRHRMVLGSADREQSHYTHFLRLPTQFKALTGPVVDFVCNGSNSRTMRVVVVGCSIGKEPYTIASALANQYPDLDFRVDAYDLIPEVVEKARSRLYDRDEVYSHERITEEFIEQTFDREGESYVVKPHIARHVSFDQADVFSPELRSVVANADVVFAQNFLFHMRPPEAHRAFDNICSLLADRAALFIDGVDLAVRDQATKANDLTPLDYEIETIHNENLRLEGWPYQYWGLEPFSTRRRNWRRRYATIFLRNGDGLKQRHQENK